MRIAVLGSLRVLLSAIMLKDKKEGYLLYKYVNTYVNDFDIFAFSLKYSY